jgi:hypothetical protein
MTTRTRYFVIASLLVLALGLGTGLVAYFIGLPTSAFSSQGGPDELQFVPRDATLVAFVDVSDVMVSDVRARLQRVLPLNGDGQQRFQQETGINIETDIDRVVAALAPASASTSAPGFATDGLVLARGRFDEVRIEAVMREHGATVEDYKGSRLITGHERRNQDPAAAPQDATAGAMSVAFVEPGLAAVGSSRLVRHAIDLKTGGSGVTDNEEMMRLVRSLESGNAWAVGRFDALSSQARLDGLVGQLPAITWFSASAHVNGGIRGFLQAETRDEESATGLRDVVRGFIALARMQAGSRPEFQTALRTLALGGTGTTVALSFDLPVELFDSLAGLAGAGQAPPPGTAR